MKKKRRVIKKELKRKRLGFKNKNNAKNKISFSLE